MVGLNFFYHSAIKGSSHKKAPAPCHHTDTQMTVKHEFKILTSARWRFVDFSAPCLLNLRTFSLQRPDFEGVISLGTMPAVTIAKEEYSNSKYIYHVKQNSSLADPVMFVMDKKPNCYYKVKKTRLTFGVPRGNHSTS